MFKSEKTKRIAITLGIAFVVIYATLFLMIQAGFSTDTFSSIGDTVMSVLSPIFIGGLIAYILNPILRFFERKVFKKMTRPRLRRGLSVLLTYLLVLLIIFGIFAAILPQIISSVQEFGSNLNNYASALQTALASTFDDLNAYIDDHPSVRNLLKNLGIYNWIGHIIEEDANENAGLPPSNGTDSLPEESDAVTDAKAPIGEEEPTDEALSDALTDTEETSPESTNGNVSDVFDNPDDETLSQKHELSFDAFLNFMTDKLSEIAVSLGESLAGLMNSLIDLGFSFFTFLKNAVLGIFISIYLLLGKERVGAQCKRIVVAFTPKKTSETFLRIAKRSDRTVGRFLLGTLIDAFFVAIVTLILLSIFRIKYALLIAIIIGITNMIPFFGPFIGAIPSALLLLIDDITTIVNNPGEPARFSCITFIILILIIQQIDGNIINPRVIGNSTGLSSLGVLLAVTIMSGFFGFFGMLLGVPVAAIIIGIGKEILEHLLKKKKLPVALAEYYSKNSMVPPETPEEELESHEHTAFYRGMVSVHEKLRHFFRKILYRNHGKSKSLKMWVKMKLGVRNVKHKVNHTIHPNQHKHEEEREDEVDETISEQDNTSENSTEANDSGKTDDTNTND